MSDLISRSELIENFRKCYSGHLGMENSDACMTFHGICNVINNTNTVYDVDKVVKELEDLEIHFDNDYFSSNREVMIVKNDAIEIVKQGGVSDDVCEWRLCDEEANVYDTSCRNPHILIEGTPKENNYEYCPYCGKNIKVVG